MQGRRSDGEASGKARGNLVSGLPSVRLAETRIGVGSRVGGLRQPHSAFGMRVAKEVTSPTACVHRDGKSLGHLWHFFGDISPHVALPLTHVILPAPHVALSPPHVSLPRPHVPCRGAEPSSPRTSLISPAPHVTLPFAHVICPAPRVALPRPSVACPQPHVISPSTHVIWRTPHVSLPATHVICPRLHVICPELAQP